MSADRATAATVADLHRTRGLQETIVLWLRLLAPLLLVLFVVAAFLVAPAPGLSGDRLLVSVAVAAFVLGVLGRNATTARLGGAHVGFVAVILAGSAVLFWAQPAGPGGVGVFVGVVCLASLLPARAGVPLLMIAFVAVEVLAAITDHDVGHLASFAVWAAFLGMVYLAFRLSEANKRAERLLAELESRQAELAEAAGLAERQRLAREMHDVLAHSLSGLILQLEGARMLAAEHAGDPRLPQAVERAHQLGRAGLDEARRAIGTLRDDDLPGPERLAEQFEADHGIPCRLTVSGEAGRLGSEARLTLFRVAQEALTNVARHARPERVELTLVHGPSGARLTVEDFAAESTPPAAVGTGGYGLTGMRERAELLGGTLVAAPTPTGFRVELELPS